MFGQSYVYTYVQLYNAPLESPLVCAAERLGLSIRIKSNGIAEQNRIKESPSLSPGHGLELDVAHHALLQALQVD